VLKKRNTSVAESSFVLAHKLEQQLPELAVNVFTGINNYGSRGKGALYKNLKKMMYQT
jgi:hypothetical protein